MTDAELSKLEWISERAAILEFDAGYPRSEAEVMAEMLWERNHADPELQTIA